MLSPRDQQFLRAILRKYRRDDAAILARSIAAITLMLLVAHTIERSSLPGWISFLLVYIPTLVIYTRYRKFAMFKMRILVELARETGHGEAADAPR